MGVSEIRLPRLGETMEEGRITLWLKKPGDAYSRGETLLEVETDKTVVEVPALSDGRLVEIIAEEGAMVAVGAPIARAESDAPSPVAPPAGLETAASPAAMPPVRPAAATPPEMTRPPHRASPRARRLAAMAGIDPEALAGSGRGGRVLGRDIPRARRTPPPPAEKAGLRLRHWPAHGACRGRIVLLHGLFDSADGWASLATALARAGFEALAPDLPHHGQATAGASDIDSVVDCVAAALDHWAGLRVTLVGHSFGGAIAARLAAAPTLDLAALVLIAPLGLGPELNAGFLDAMLHAETPQTLGRAMAQLGAGAVPGPRALAELHGRIAAHRSALQDLIGTVTRDGRQTCGIGSVLATAAAPVALLWGRADDVLPWEQALAAPPRAALHLFADCGHAPHWQQPAVCADIIAALAGPGQDARP